MMYDKWDLNLRLGRGRYPCEKMTVEIVELALPDGPLMSSELSDAFIAKIGGRAVIFVLL